nr:hypothetical protein [Tanacetum cinerariifolium]
MTAGSSRPYTSGSSGTSGKQRVIVYYNCKGEGHMSKQCTKPKRKRDEKWFKDKVLPVQAQANGQVLQQEDLEFLADPGIAETSSTYSPALQDDIILSMLEQLKTQVVNYTMINQDNKNVNEILTAEFERYKDQVKNLKEQNNVDKASESCARSLEIDNLKHSLSEHLKEKEYLVQKVTLLKNNFQKEKSRNIDGELALEKQSVQSEEPNLSSSTTIVEFPKELPKLSMAVEQHCVEKNKFQDKIKNVLKDNERLLEQAISVDIVNIVVHDHVNSACKTVNVCERCVTIEIELQKNFIKKDTVIVKLKKRLKSLSGNVKEEKIKRELEEIETINIELDHRVTKLVAENEHLKQNFKQLYDSIKSLRVRSKVQCDDLIKQVNIKSAENSDLNVSLREKVLVIIALKETLSKLKGKAVVNDAVTLHPIDPELLNIDVAPLAPQLRNNRAAHTDYLRHTQEETATLREIVKRTKLMAVTPKNNDKKIRFTEYIPLSGNTPAKTTSSTNMVSNTPVLSSTGVNLLSSASGSQPQGNTKNDRIQRVPSKAKKNKLEDHPRTVRPSLNKKKSVVDTKAISFVTNSKLNVNADLKCATCNGCLFSDNHDSCVLAYINYVNASLKSKSVKKPVNRKFWQPTGKMFTTVGHIWRPTGQTFTLLGNVCPLTRITTTAIVPLREPILIESNTDKPVVTLVYSRKSKSAKKKVPVVQIVLWYLDSGCSKHMTGDRSQLINFVQKFLGTVRFENDHVAKVMGYDLEVAFRQHTCFIRNLDGVDLLTGSQGNNLYTLSLQDTMASSPICLFSKASKTKSWLWQRRLSHLNFGAINHLARQGRIRGLPKLKFKKDHLFSACAMGKKAVATACYTQNCSIIRLHHGKTPSELLRNKLHDLSFLRMFGALCYPTNDSENLGKLQPKADICYAPTKKAFRIYNRCTRRIVETIHVDFDELMAMAFEQSSSGPALNEITPATISSGLVQKSSSSTPYVPPSRND